jgi:hypothetical protein
MEEKQSQITEESPKVNKGGNRGGYRPGSGRKVGSTNKLSAATLISSLEKCIGRKYEEQLAINYQECILANDRLLLQRYDQMFLSKIVADRNEVDVTSNGQKLSTSFSFIPIELPEWKSEE